eukprot:3488581-Ditylum_brightwellii.AAC.1
MDAAKYATRTGGGGMYVTSPQHLGTFDSNIAANSVHIVQSWHYAEHKQLVEDNMVEKTETLPKWLMSKIEDQDTRLNTFSLQDMFNHAYDCRGKIDDDLVDKYINNFNAPINMTQRFNAYVEHQEEYRDFFSNMQQSITNQQLSGKGQLHVGQTGIFHEKYLTWKHHPIANKT